VSAAVRTCPQCGTEYSADVKFCPLDGTTLRAAAGASLIGTVIADRYHILKKLGEGGMGQVYLAEHVKMGRPSAIKVMAPSMMQDADAISRFNREASNASRISHPNVAAIYDFGETSDGLIYLAMEFVEGEPLTSLLERQGPLPAARAASIIRQTAGALDAAHERGIIHRDLKPDNIMIARNRDGSDLVKVVDFGIAKSQHGAGQKVTKTGLVVGTPEYMSPEQLAGDSVDSRSDTFALALVGFHMLTGTLPYEEGTAQETMIRRLTDRAHTLSEARPGVPWPPALEQTIAGALEREAAKRPASSGEFAAAFSKSVEGLETAEEGGATHVMGAVPRTRVDDGTPTVVSKATPTVPLPKTAAMKTPAPMPAPKGKRGLILASVGSAVAIGAVAAVMMSRGKPAGSDATPAGGAKPLSLQTDSTARAESARKMNPSLTGARPGAPKPGAAPVGAAPLAGEAAARLSSDQARQQVQRAADMFLDTIPGTPARAIGMLEQALPALATRRDTLEAYIHLGEFWLRQATEPPGTDDPAAKRTACNYLDQVRQDPSKYKAKVIEPLLGECK